MDIYCNYATGQNFLHTINGRVSTLNNSPFNQLRVETGGLIGCSRKYGCITVFSFKQRPYITYIHVSFYTINDFQGFFGFLKNCFWGILGILKSSIQGFSGFTFDKPQYIMINSKRIPKDSKGFQGSRRNSLPIRLNPAIFLVVRQNTHPRNMQVLKAKQIEILVCTSRNFKNTEEYKILRDPSPWSSKTSLTSFSSFNSLRQSAPNNLATESCRQAAIISSLYDEDHLCSLLSPLLLHNILCLGKQQFIRFTTVEVSGQKMRQKNSISDGGYKSDKIAVN